MYITHMVYSVNIHIRKVCTNVPVYWLNWYTDMPAQNSSFLQRPVRPTIHISTNDPALSCQSYLGRQPGKE